MGSLHALGFLFGMTLVLTSGCATIVGSGPDMVPVDSDPPGARILVNGSQVGRTPATIMLDRQLSGTISIEKQGYESINVQKPKVVNGWVFGNLCLGGVPGLVVDALTGNIMKYNDTPVMVVLTPVASETPPAGAGPEVQEGESAPISLNAQSGARR